MTRRRADTAARARSWLADDSTIDEIAEGGDHEAYKPGSTYIVELKAALLDNHRIEFAGLAVTPRAEADSQRPLWCVYGTARQHRAGLYIDELAVTPFLPDSPTRRREIDSRIMRAISPTAIIVAIRDELSAELVWETAYQDRDRELFTNDVRERLEQEARPAGTPQSRRHRRQRPPEFYETIARGYLQLASVGWKRGIHAELATLLALDDTDARRIRDHIHRARELKFLSPGKSGKVGATPGPNLRP